MMAQHSISFPETGYKMVVCFGPEGQAVHTWGIAYETQEGCNGDDAPQSCLSPRLCAPAVSAMSTLVCTAFYIQTSVHPLACVFFTLICLPLEMLLVHF